MLCEILIRRRLAKCFTSQSGEESEGDDDDDDEEEEESEEEEKTKKINANKRDVKFNENKRK